MPPVFVDWFTIEVTPALKLLVEALLPDDPLLPHADTVVAKANTPAASASILRIRIFRLNPSVNDQVVLAVVRWIRPMRQDD